MGKIWMVYALKQTKGEMRMKRAIVKPLLTVLSLAVALVMIVPAGSASAADSKWINKVLADYKAYNQKVTSSYKNYQEQIDASYNQYLTQYTATMTELETKVLSDLKQWDEKLEADYNELKEKYGDDRSKTSALRTYDRYINQNFRGSPMNLYATEANRNYRDSTMWVYNKALNENFIDSKTWRYSKAINPNYLDSAAFKYSKAVNENYYDSPMQRLKHASSKNFYGSPIYQYSRGKISKTKAQQEYAKIYKKQTERLNAIVAKSKQDIANRAAVTRQELDLLHAKSVDVLEQRREEALKKISDLRIEICGEGLTWQPLLKNSAQ